MAKSKTSRNSTTNKASANTHLYELSIDLQVLRHLGIGLYSNVPAVVSEMVANAWDADADSAEIIVSGEEIIIRDDGLGMNAHDANKKFLTVGYQKRKSEMETAKHHRKPMGRKGIGKLSAFAIADEVEVRSIKTDAKTKKELGRASFLMDVEKIEEQAKLGKPYYPMPLDDTESTFANGTQIVLRKLKRKRSIQPQYIRVNLARRFSILSKDFQVSVNGDEVTIAERQYWDKLQFVWGLGTSANYELAKSGNKVRKFEVLPNTVTIGDVSENVSGWLGTVHYPRELKDEQSDIDNNGIVVLARGKLIHENLLPFARTSRIFAEYVVGEINADWLDEDAKEDMATSGRQSMKEEDPRFAALQEYLKDRLIHIADRWTAWRNDVGLKDAVQRHPVLQKWLDSMSKDNRRHAEKLVATIEGMPVADIEDKRELLKHGIMAFETLALKGNLSALTGNETIDLKTLKRIMSAMEDLEVAHYYQVAKTRWTVLQQVEKLVDRNEKERFLQEKIYDHTWLMDAAWERPTREKRKEKRFTDALKAKKLGLDRNQQLSRYDIQYLTVSGKDLVVELKRSGRKLTIPTIIDQVRKYADIMKTLAKEKSMSLTPNFDIIVLLGDLPAGYSLDDENALKNYNARVITYEVLIEHARSTYGDYLRHQRKVERIQRIVDSL
jgi:hypothetical protein